MTMTSQCTKAHTLPSCKSRPTDQNLAKSVVYSTAQQTNRRISGQKRTLNEQHLVM
jgi:hypothetical protein